MAKLDIHMHLLGLVKETEGSYPICEATWVDER